MHRSVVSVLLLCLVLLTLAPTGAPVRLSYVYSDSMEPTLQTDDGYLIVATDDVGVGDVVTFHSPGRDEHVTHRLVGRSEKGFITKGDNNPTTDQAAGYAHVRRDDIVGRVLTVGGRPLTIPHLGTVVEFTRSQFGALLGLLGVAIVADQWRRPGKRPSRDVLRVRDVLVPMYAAALVVGVALVLLGGQVHTVAFVAVEGPATAPNTLSVGEPRETSFVVDRSSLPFVHSVVGTDGMSVTERSRNDTAVAVTARVPPPQETGVHRGRVRVHQYPAVLPLAVLRRLDAVHPLLAASTVVVEVLSPLVVAGILLDGRQPLRPVRLPARFRRWLRP